MFSQPVKKLSLNQHSKTVEQIWWSRGNFSPAFLTCPFIHFLPPVFTASQKRKLCESYKRVSSFVCLPGGLTVEENSRWEQSSDSLELDFMRWEREIWRQGTFLPSGIGTLSGRRGVEVISGFGAQACAQRGHPALSSWTKWPAVPDNCRKDCKLNRRRAENRKDNFIWLLNFLQLFSLKRLSVIMYFKNG